MSICPPNLPRSCQQVKPNGIQCGSPAMRQHNFCYFHLRWHRKGMQVNACLKSANVKAQEPIFKLTLEDANSIHVGVAHVMRQVVAKTIDDQSAHLLLYALQVASANVKNTSFDLSQRNNPRTRRTRPATNKAAPEVPSGHEDLKQASN